METVELFTPEFQEDPYPTYRILREQHPVYQDPRTGGWILSRYADVYGALADHETFSSENATGVNTRLVEDKYGVVDRPAPLPLIFEDQPRHTRIRRLVNRPLSRKEMKKFLPYIEELVDDLLDAATDQPIDLVPALAVPLPVMMVARVLGIPPEDYQQFKEWSDAATGVLDIGPEARDKAVGEMYAYFREVFASRRDEPLNDLISVLVHAEMDGDSLDEPDLLGICHLVLLAGNETTTNLISNLMNVLVDRPDLWTQLREDRSLVDTAIEEGLRFDSPVQMLWRRPTRDVTLHGVTIPEGSTVAVAYGSANRDDDEFPDADTFRLDRELGKHIAFGHGIHYCMGAPLARSEVSIALNGLLDRYAGLERAEGPAERLSAQGFSLRGFGRLPIRFLT